METATEMDTDRVSRAECMRDFGGWLRQRSITQTFAAGQLGLHRGYLSNLVAGKHVANEATCQAARRLMEAGDGPAMPLIDLDTLQTETIELSTPSTSRPTRPCYSHRQPLSVCEGKVVADVVCAMIRQTPRMTVDELVSVTKAVAEEFRAH